MFSRSPFVARVPLEEGAVTGSDYVSVPLPPLPQLPVVGRLQMFAESWEMLELTPWHRQVLQQGLRLHFLSLPPLSPSPLPVRLPVNPLRRQVLLDEIEALVSKHALEIPSDGAPGFFSHMFTVQKKSGKFRPVIDLKLLNQHVICTHFKMESDLTVLRQLQVGDWAASIDLSDAYLHLPIHQDSRRYLRFCIQGKIYQFRALCFGLNVAPKVFTKMLQPVAQYLRLRGIRVHRYLDDWLITASSPEMALQHTQETIDLLSTLGWLVNKDKSELVPSQNIVFLGMGIDFASGLVRPSQETLNKISAWSVILHSVCVLSVKDFLSLLGLLNHACKFIDLGRLHLRPLQFYLKCKQADLRELYAYVSLDPIFFVAWSWWENTTRLMAGVPFQGPVPQVTLFTDASLQGWGATVLSHSAKGLWSKAERRLHITVLELRAVRLGLQALLHLVSDRCVHIMSDNVATVAYIRNEGGTHSISLYREVRDLLTWCRQHGIRLVPAFIPGCRNVGADSLSRQRKVLSTEWSLQKAVFRRLLQAVPDIEVDLFATRWNHQMPRFVSPFPDTLAWRVDALSFPWDGLTAYAYPPQVLIPEVLNRVINSSVLLYLVAPLWRAQTWYPTLLHLLVDLPLQLRPNRLLVQPQSQIYHSRPKFLNLHVFPLSSDEYKRQAFLQRLQSLHLDPYGSHQYASTNLTIGNSVAGVIHGISVPTMRL
jgi:hypothetical protein